MTDQVVTRSHIFNRGVAAFVRGATRDSHEMNWHAPALTDWLAGFDSAERSYQRITLRQAEVVKAMP